MLIEKVNRVGLLQQPAHEGSRDEHDDDGHPQMPVRSEKAQNFGLLGSRAAFIDGRGNCGSGGVHCGGAYSDTAQVSR